MGIETDPIAEVKTDQNLRGRTSDTPTNADYAAVQRANSTLNSIDLLSQQLAPDGETYELPYRLPAGFLLSIIVPIFNERKTIVRVIQSLNQLPLPIEIIVVDDGSNDGSVAVLTKLNYEFPQLRVCIQEKNEGKGAALRRGFETATGSHVMVQDADLEYSPNDIPSLIEPLARGEADVVFGSRFLEGRRTRSSKIHRFGNQLLTKLSNRATGLQLTDMETGYKIIRRDLLQDMKLEQDRFGIEVELTAKLAKQKARIVERPISYYARGWEDGKKIGWRDAIQAMLCILQYR